MGGRGPDFGDRWLDDEARSTGAACQCWPTILPSTSECSCAIRPFDQQVLERVRAVNESNTTSRAACIRTGLRTGSEMALPGGYRSRYAARCGLTSAVSGDSSLRRGMRWPARRKQLQQRSSSRCAERNREWKNSRQLTGVAAPMPMINIDTDKIFPAIYLKTIKRTGLAK